MIYRHVLSHRDDESCLTHSWTSGDDDEVGVLPARGKFIDVLEARGESTDPFLSVSCDLHFIDRTFYKGVDRDEVSGRVLLGYLKECSLCLLDLLLDIDDIIIGSLQS